MSVASHSFGALCLVVAGVRRIPIHVYDMIEMLKWGVMILTWWVLSGMKWKLNVLRSMSSVIILFKNASDKQIDWNPREPTLELGGILSWSHWY